MKVSSCTIKSYNNRRNRLFLFFRRKTVASRNYSGKHSKEHSLPKSFKYFLEMRISVALICNRYRNLVVLFSSFNDTKIVKIKFRENLVTWNEITEVKWTIGECVIICFAIQKQYSRIITDLPKLLKLFTRYFGKLGNLLLHRILSA